MENKIKISLTQKFAYMASMVVVICVGSPVINDAFEAFEQWTTNDPDRSVDYPQPTNNLVSIPTLPKEKVTYGVHKRGGKVTYTDSYYSEDKDSFMQCVIKIGPKDSHKVEYECIRYYGLNSGPR